MKKLPVFILLSLTLLISFLAFAPDVLATDKVLIDSYEVHDTDQGFNAIFPSETYTSAYGQTFTTPDKQYNLAEAQFYLGFATGTPTGHLQARLYDIIETYGVNATPTGEPLVSSELVDIETLEFENDWIAFTFSDQYTMAENHHYAITVLIIDGNILADFEELDATTGADPNHDGNLVAYDFGEWVSVENPDITFRVYGVDVPPVAPPPLPRARHAYEEPATGTDLPRNAGIVFLFLLLVALAYTKRSHK